LINRYTTPSNIWVWKKNGIIYTAILRNNIFTVRTANNNHIILRIINLTADSQKKIIENMHKIKKECDIYG